jgi:hypothetical protein
MGAPQKKVTRYTSGRSHEKQERGARRSDRRSQRNIVTRATVKKSAIGPAPQCA